MVGMERRGWEEMGKERGEGEREVRVWEEEEVERIGTRAARER